MKVSRYKARFLNLAAISNVIAPSRRADEVPDDERRGNGQSYDGVQMHPAERTEYRGGLLAEEGDDKALEKKEHHKEQKDKAVKRPDP